MNGPLVDLRVIELAHELASYAGKQLGDLGADVIKVEPPEGERTRGYPPFVDDEPHPDRSLFFWTYNTSKRSVTLDLEQEEGRSVFSELIAGADVVIESGAPGELANLGIDYPDIGATNERLIWISVTPFGREMPRSNEVSNDLTLLAGAGPAWSSGYDDHSIPPVRGGGNQGYHTAANHAVMAALTALAYRDNGGGGQFIEVNAHAASNVTTEAATYSWLVAGETVQRQTGRHAGVKPSQPSQVKCADGRWVNSGFPARKPAAYSSLLEWIETLGATDEFPNCVLLEMGAALDHIDMGMIQTDPVVGEIAAAARDAIVFIAERVTADEFFLGGQSRDFTVGIIYSPEEVLADPHFIARGWPTEVEHPELDRTVTYAGQPYRFERSPWAISRRPPLLGEHTAEVLAELGR